MKNISLYFDKKLTVTNSSKSGYQFLGDVISPEYLLTDASDLLFKFKAKLGNSEKKFNNTYGIYIPQHIFKNQEKCIVFLFANSGIINLKDFNKRKINTLIDELRRLYT